MNDLLIVLCTFPDLGTARETGTALVAAQLAACVNLIPAVESIYRWSPSPSPGRKPAPA